MTYIYPGKQDNSRSNSIWSVENSLENGQVRCNEGLSTVFGDEHKRTGLAGIVRRHGNHARVAVVRKSRRIPEGEVADVHFWGAS